MAHHPRFGGGIAIAMLAFGVVEAAAEPRTQPMRLLYRADRSCPTSAEFLEKLELGALDLELVAVEGAPWDILVTLRAEAGKIVGRLLFSNPDGATTRRELVGASCEAVAAGLRIATALALDPTRTPEQPAPLEPKAAPTRIPAVRATSVSQELTSDMKPTIALRSRASWQWGLGVAGGVAYGPTPDIGQQAAFFLDATAGRRASLRAYGLYAFPRTDEREWGVARFSATLGALEVCPTRFWLTDDFALAPCAFGTLGLLEASGTVLEPGGDSDAGRYFWADVGLSARAEWIVSSLWQLEIRGTAATPLTRYRYTLTNPTTVVGEAPLLAAAGTAGLMLRFQ